MPSQEKFPSGYDSQKDKIEIVDYDPAWPDLFLKEKDLLNKVLTSFPGLSVDHYGSTAVPGLAAKPIIDIMIRVESRDCWPNLIKPLESLGYIHQDDNHQKNEMFFVKGMPPYGEKRTHHVHVFDRQW